MTFSGDIAKFALNSRIKADKVLRVTAIEAFSNLQRRSPVDTGRFRGSWRLSTRRINLSVNDENDPTLWLGQALANEAKFGDTIYISNNLFYAPFLEAGHSKQAPDGVLRPVFQQLVRDFPRIARSVQSGNVFTRIVQRVRGVDTGVTRIDGGGP